MDGVWAMATAYDARGKLVYSFFRLRKAFFAAHRQKQLFGPSPPRVFRLQCCLVYGVVQKVYTHGACALKYTQSSSLQPVSSAPQAHLRPV